MTLSAPRLRSPSNNARDDRMRNGMTALLGGMGGAVLAIMITFAAADTGVLPGLGDGHIRSYLLSHPELVGEMTEKVQIQQQAADNAKMAAAITKIGLNTVFHPQLAFGPGPPGAKKSLVGFYHCAGPAGPAPPR